MKFRKHLVPVVVHDLPPEWAFAPDGALRPKLRQYVNQRVLRVIAGPHAVDAVIDVRRPYFQPLS